MSYLTQRGLVNAVNFRLSGAGRPTKHYHVTKAAIPLKPTDMSEHEVWVTFEVIESAINERAAEERKYTNMQFKK